MKKLFSILICLFMISGLSINVQAAYDYDLMYDATELLDQDYCYSIGNEIFPSLSEEAEVQIRIDVVDNLEDETIDDYARIFYKGYGYGYGTSCDGILLMLYLTEDETGLSYQDHTIYIGGDNSADLNAYREDFIDALSASLNPESFSGDLTSDEQAFESAVESYISVFQTLFTGNGRNDPTEVTGSYYVFDYAQILTEEEIESLSAQAEKIDQTYGTPVYIMTIQNYSEYAGNIDSYTRSVYTQFELGSGSDHSGAILVLSMEDRDYALVSHEGANVAFSDEGKDWLAKQYLDNFKKDDWYGGFSDYLSGSEKLLQMAADGKPMSIETSTLTLVLTPIIALLFGLLIAFIVLNVMKSKMKNVAEKSEASQFVEKDGVDISLRSDTFINRTVTRTYDPPKEERKSSSGSSGGFSSKTGKF